MIGYISLFAAIAFMIYGAFKGFGTIPMSIIASLIIILGHGKAIWETMLLYASSYGGSVTSFLFIFVSAAFFAKCMDITGAAMRIGYKFVEWFGSKNAMLVLTLMVAVLTYGGVNLWVVIFVTLPIAYVLFKEANLPRHLIVAPLYFGSCTFTMTALPGCPTFPNIFPAQALGTTMTAAPVLGILASVGLFILGYIYLKIAENIARKNGETFAFPEGFDKSKYEVKTDSLPPAVTSFIPIICSVGIIIIGSNVDLPIATDSNLLTTLAMLTASIVCLLLNFRYLNDGREGTKADIIKRAMTAGSADGLGSIANLAAIVAFGAVVSSTATFSSIVDWLINLKIPVYWKAVVSSGVISGVSGSASAGVRLCMQYLGDYFVKSGSNLPILHRLVALASGSIDTVPYAPGFFVTFPLLGLTHKDCYRHVFFTTLLIPAIVVIVATMIVSAIY